MNFTINDESVALSQWVNFVAVDIAENLLELPQQSHITYIERKLVDILLRTKGSQNVTNILEASPTKNIHNSNNHSPYSQLEGIKINFKSINLHN